MGIYFEWALFVITLTSGIIYFIDQRYFYKKRLALARAGIAGFDQLPKKEQLELVRAPLLGEWSRSLFVVFLAVFLIRSFLIEPYIVPSGSMLPTIQLDDFILVNKFAYGVHLPFTGTVIIPVHTPKTGDIAVFKNPTNPQVSFIKTIIGVPGDRISYINKKLYINNKPVLQKFITDTLEPGNANLTSIMVKEYQSELGGKTHYIYNTPAVSSTDFKNLLVPKDSYFVMGDNRDNSDDSRIWGFVPQKNLTGRAWLIFLSWDAVNHKIRFKRIGMVLP
jgi:signal peptidase I